jgi:hypothetical protein
LLFFREKACTTRIQKWGLFTYKTRARQTSQEASKEPSRKRRERSLQRKTENPKPAFPTSQVIAPTPMATSLIQPNAYRRHEVVLYSTDRLVYALFGDSKLGFSHGDLIFPKIGGSNNYRMLWMEIADLYHTAWIYSNDIELPERIQKARSTLRDMVHDLDSCSEDVSMELKRGRYLVMISTFWRLCHKLIRYDRRWYQRYPFVSEFLLSFAEFVYQAYGLEHPVYKLLDALAQIASAEIEVLLRLGTIRTIERMTSGLYVKRRMVVRCWTDFLYQ